MIRRNSRDLEVFGSVGDLETLDASAAPARAGNEPRNVEVFGEGRAGRPAEKAACDVRDVKTLLDPSKPLGSRDAEVFSAAECPQIAPVAADRPAVAASGRNLEF